MSARGGQRYASGFWSFVRSAAKRSESRSSRLNARGRPVYVGRDILHKFKTLKSHSSPPTRFSYSICCSLRCEGNKGEKTIIIKKKLKRNHSTFIFCFNWAKIKYYMIVLLLFPNSSNNCWIFSARLPVSNIWNNLLHRVTVPFWCEKINNRPRLLFEETRYFGLHEAGIPSLSGYVEQTSEGLLTKSIQALEWATRKN